jgi:hypothetical protein
MSGNVNSLNASVSAALVTYEIYHKRGWGFEVLQTKWLWNYIPN